MKFDNAVLTEVIGHTINNKILGGKLELSNKDIKLEKISSQFLLNHFLKPFRNIIEVFHFHHDIDIKLNEVFVLSDKIFEDENFIEASANIARHLYTQTRHPAIKSGELLIGVIDDITYGNNICKGIVISKSEQKTKVLKIEGNKNMAVEVMQGISEDKVDKACLILNIDFHEGFKVFTYEHSNSDTDYWRHDFLSLKIINESMKQTADFINICKEYSNSYILNKYGKKDQVKFLLNTMKYISTTDILDLKTFETELFSDSEDKQKFQKEILDYNNKNNLQNYNNFKVSKPAVAFQRKKIRNEIKLDTNILIKVDSNKFLNPEEYIEQGFDNKRKMKYYKLFYNSEL